VEHFLEVLKAIRSPVVISVPPLLVRALALLVAEVYGWPAWV
jgi:hypothetical protein